MNLNLLLGLADKALAEATLLSAVAVMSAAKRLLVQIDAANATLVSALQQDHLPEAQRGPGVGAMAFCSTLCGWARQHHLAPPTPPPELMVQEQYALRLAALTVPAIPAPAQLSLPALATGHEAMQQGSPSARKQAGSPSKHGMTLSNKTHTLAAESRQSRLEGQIPVAREQRHARLMESRLAAARAAPAATSAAAHAATTDVPEAMTD